MLLEAIKLDSALTNNDETVCKGRSTELLGAETNLNYLSNATYLQKYIY